MSLGPLLAGMRTLSAALIRDFSSGLCNIEQATLADDGHAGKTQEWEAINAEPLPCVAYPGSGRTHILGEVPQSKTVFTVIVAGGTLVVGKHRIVLLAGDTEPERIVEITHVLPQLGVVVEIVGTVKI